MKKLFVFALIAVFGMSFTVPEDSSAPPPVSYGFTVKWDPSNCNCGTILLKTLSWSLIQLPPNYCPITAEENVTVTGTEKFVSGTSNCIDVDCENCYYLEATIKYYDSSGLCCSATNSTTLSGDELHDETAELLIEM